VGILARGTRALTLDSNDLSHSWKPRLFSLVEHESLNDWLSYLKNEQDEWLRFGAGMYRSSWNNTLAYNSRTHGGDGLFLWAGQETMDTGKVGSNDNVFLVNDFSFAPTNGMEATSSRNQFTGNRVAGNTHGL
jgi:hypothetical protein